MCSSATSRVSPVRRAEAAPWSMAASICGRVLVTVCERRRSSRQALAASYGFRVQALARPASVMFSRMMSWGMRR